MPGCILSCDVKGCELCKKIERQKLKKNKLGEGANAPVYSMRFNSDQVAVKVFKPLDEIEPDGSLEYLYMRDAHEHGCRHVMRPLAFVECRHSDTYYYMMEQVDGLVKYRKLTEEQADAVLFQIVYTLAKMWDELGLVHNDLHKGNVFYTTKDVPTQKVWKYTYKGKTYSLPSLPFIVKIGDFGLANSEARPNDEILGIGVIPNEPLAVYDTATYLYATLGDHDYSDTVKNTLFDRMFGTHSSVIKKYYQDYGRPIFDGVTPLDLTLTPGQLLTSGAFDRFLKPRKGTSVSMC